jgi:hypothetical protein
MVHLLVGCWYPLHRSASHCNGRSRAGRPEWRDPGRPVAEASSLTRCLSGTVGGSAADRGGYFTRPRKYEADPGVGGPPYPAGTLGSV